MSALGWVVKKILKVLLYIIVIVLIFGAYLVWKTPVLSPKTYGVTFSPSQASVLGLDPHKVYAAIFDDLGVRHIRIGAYWNQIEDVRGTYDFSTVDWQVEEAEKRGAELIFALGRKVPRWPECHIPGWAVSASQKEQDEALLTYMGAVINRYKKSSAIRVWQVENEPFLPFGECPSFSAGSIDREIALVHSLDSRPVMVTDSGELSLWVRAASRGDVFGTTMYRRVFNKYFGAIEYPLPPAFFRLKRGFTELIAGKKPMVVIELQGEPWINKWLPSATIEEQYTSVDPEYFKYILNYASRTGFDTFYMWGVEWWYWLKQNGHPEIWDIMKSRIR